AEIEATDVNSARYWRRNLESQVDFASAIKVACTKFHSRQFLELGPHAALEVPLRDTLSSCSLATDQYMYASALTRGKNAVYTVLRLCGTLFQYGHDGILYEKVSPNLQHSTNHTILHDLPSYAWDHSETPKIVTSRVVREFRG